MLIVLLEPGPCGLMFLGSGVDHNDAGRGPYGLDCTGCSGVMFAAAQKRPGLPHNTHRGHKWTLVKRPEMAGLVVVSFPGSHQRNKETGIDEPHRKLGAVHHIIDGFTNSTIEGPDQLIDRIHLRPSGTKPRRNGIPNERRF